ncbi:hypothetical protein NKR19_g1271 [Coniochaeta hoffmannii]|uniref:Uncharacterized protein n=1 Tax=Coniochaeta hoffmannii TaxID=91930 RepID=A0AA38SIS8_9PEZI|nr:hypothetical protein NKR19_g1271 [Coniochaeta hoffmannii]
MSAHLQSSGRGGAGNIVDASKSPKLQPEDLQTPTLKTSVVTTGRGGSGNMAKNTDPAETRARQDVEPVTRRPSHGATHVGRGGTGNVFKGDEAQAAKDEVKKGSAISDDHHGRSSPKPDDKGWAEKGKGFLFGHGNKK